MVLIKIAAGLAGACGIMWAYGHGKTQHELKNSKWFREAAVKVAAHEGVHELIGKPPLEMGTVSRHLGDKDTPLIDVAPQPLYLIEVPIKGTQGEGKMKMYLNYLVPIEEVRENIDAWNVGLLEVQVGKNKENRFIVS